MKMKRTGTLLALVVMTTITLTGCFWTPDDAGEGGITLVVDSAQIGGSQLSGSQQIGGFDGFFIGYVIADDLLRGDQATAEQAFDEVDDALIQATSSIQSVEDIQNFSVEVTFPAIQLQANVFAGETGSNTFRGLRADREYLVVVIASQFDGSEGMGYNTTVIKGGENKDVNLSLGDNWASFYQFLESRYGVPLQPATIVIGTPPIESPPLYYDFLSSDTADLPTTSVLYEEWYSQATVLNRNGDPIGKTGDREAIGTQGVVIEGIAPGKTWRLMIASWPERQYGETSSQIFLSEPTLIGSGETVFVSFSGFDLPGFSSGSLSVAMGSDSNYMSSGAFIFQS